MSYVIYKGQTETENMTVIANTFLIPKPSSQVQREENCLHTCEIELAVYVPQQLVVFECQM